MKHHLNYGKEDPNYILLEKIFKIIGSRKYRTIIAFKRLKKLKTNIYRYTTPIDFKTAYKSFQKDN